MAQCDALSNPDTVWNFCPALAPAYLYAVLFALITIAHIVQAFLYRKVYSLVIIISAGMQTATYILRILSIKNPTSSGYYTGWFVLIMIAPIFTNAYIYMIQGRMVYNFTRTGRTFGLPAWRFGTIFVLLDVVAFFVQAAGAVIASGTDTDTPSELKQLMTGLHIYMGGIGFQQLCILGFVAAAVRFHLDVRRQGVGAAIAQGDEKTAVRLLYVQYAALGLITVRIIFRLVEYSGGLDSSIPNHEAYQYVFDSTLMMVALVLYNIWHPGRLMPGKEAMWPKRKERKERKKQGLPIYGRLAGEEAVGEQKALHDGFSGSDIELGGGSRQSPVWQQGA